MNSPVQRLEQTGTALRVALTNQDWSAIGELDAQCRQAIDEAMVEAVLDEELLRTSMQDLLALYHELVTVCRAEQQRICNELVQLNQTRQGAKVYQMFG